MGYRVLSLVTLRETKSGFACSKALLQPAQVFFLFLVSIRIGWGTKLNFVTFRPAFYATSCSARARGSIERGALGPLDLRVDL